MANRSHLYAFDRFERGLPLAPRGLHEWNSVIPPSHLLLMSGKPRSYMSSIDTGKKVAIVADAEAGLARFLAFLRALEASQKLPADFVDDARTAEAFLTSDAGKGRFFLLEPFEIFAFSTKPAEAQCAAVAAKQIPAFAAEVDALLAKPPDSLFARPPKWLAAIRESWNMTLGLGDWGPILYYRLDG